MHDDEIKAVLKLKWIVWLKKLVELKAIIFDEFDVYWILQQSVIFEYLNSMIFIFIFTK